MKKFLFLLLFPYLVQSATNTLSYTTAQVQSILSNSASGADVTNVVNAEIAAITTFTNAITLPSLTFTDTNLWEDLRTDAANLTLVGVTNIPTIVLSNSVIPVLPFNNTGNQVTYLTSQMPHSYWTNTPIEPHMHILNNGTIQTSAWSLISSWTVMDGTSLIQTQTMTFVSSTNLANYHEYFSFGLLTNSSTPISSMLHFKLNRVASNTTTTVNLMSFDIHYRYRTIGSQIQ